MLKPVEMNLISILALKEDLKEVVQALVESEAIHIEESKKFISSESSSIQAVNTDDKLDQGNDLIQRIEWIIDKMNISTKEFRANKEQMSVVPFKITHKVKGEFIEIESKLKDLFKKLDQYGQEVEHEQKLSWLIPMLNRLGIDISVLSKYKHIKLRCGVLPSGKFLQLRDSLKNVNYNIKTSRYLKDKILVCIISETGHIKTVDKALKGINFEVISLSSIIEKFSKGVEKYSLSNLAEDIEYKLWEAKEGIADVKRELKNLKNKIGFKLIKWRNQLKINIDIMKSMQKFLESKHGYCISGWIPSNKIGFLKKKVSKIDKKSIKINIKSAKELEDIDIQVPTKFNNPAIIRPFQRLVTTYGVPNYNNIDPTIFVALSFVGMFGMMFSDVGHGAVLLLLGLAPFIFRKLKKLRDFGVILSSCGLSSVIFGFLFGSIFGLEHIIPALWFRPIKNPVYFLKIGVFVGIGMITLGMILNILQNISNNNFRETFFGQWGFFSSIFYWLCLGMFWKVATTGEINVSLPILSLILLIPLLIITFGDIIMSKFKKGQELDLAETIFKPIELMLGILTNTISFVRVAAFGLTHAALMMTLFIIVGFIGKQIPGLKESIIVEGNIGIIILEGLIVFIQTLRLEYYEFFSKFFKGEGKLFEPLKLNYSSD